MTEGVQDKKSNSVDLEFEFKKIEFERAFGHITAFDTRISIGIAMETLLVGVIVMTIIAAFEGKIQYYLFSCIPTTWLLLLPLISIIFSMFFTLFILFDRIDYPFPSPNPKNKDKANKWMEGYVKEAEKKIKKRHKKWNWALSMIIVSFISFAIITILIVINN